MPRSNKKRAISVIFILIVLLAVGVLGSIVFLRLPRTPISRTDTNSAVVDQKNYQSAITTARTLLWKDIASGKASSAEVTIMDNGQVVYTEGFGMADREKSIPVDKNTMFNIGSVSKVYVAAAIMKLVDDGRVSLDEPVVTYLPEFKMADPRYKDITVRMIISHSPGLPGSNYANAIDSAHSNTNILNETLDTLSKSYLKAAPGDVAPYTNDGYSLAEMIIEKVSGKKYIDFLSENFFKPLGLKNTGLSIGEIKGKQIASYYDPATGKAQPAEAVSILGAGGLSATTEDLCRFVLAVTAENNIVLKPSAVAEFIKPQQPAKLNEQASKNPFKWGLGWDYANVPVYDNHGFQVLGKDGGTYEYTSMVYAIPSKRICVAAFESGMSNVDQNVTDVLNAVLVAKGMMPQEKKTVAVPPEPQTIPDEYALYNGYYVSTGGAVKQVTIDIENKNVTSHDVIDQLPDMVLVYNNGHFTNNDLASKGYLDFVTIDGEQYMLMHASGPGIDNITSQKAKPVSNPVSLKINMDNKEWIQRNVYPLVEKADFSSHLITSNHIKGLPGYVYFNGLKKVQSSTFAAMPVSSMRDLTELELIDKDGQTWARNSDRLYSPADQVTLLKSGNNYIKIGSDGLNEWLKTDEGIVLKFTKPDFGRIVIFDTTQAKVIYDSLIDTEDIYVPKGSFIEFLGNPGDAFGASGSTVNL